MLLADYFQRLATYFLGDQDQEYYVQLQDTKYSRDLPQGGMEIPCQYTFHEEKSMITKLKALLSENNNQLSVTSEPQTCSPTCSEHCSPMKHQNKTEATDNSHQCANLRKQ